VNPILKLAKLNEEFFLFLNYDCFQKAVVNAEYVNSKMCS
jgi:hypothetical protein